MNNYDAGFYWVKVYSEWTIGELVIESNKYLWYLMGSEEVYDFGFVHEIGEKITRT
jgi:hypothetical protein